MTEELNIFCNKLKILLNSMNHREELILKTDDSFCNMVFNHEMKIEKLHNVNLPNAIQFLMIDHKVNICSGRRIWQQEEKLKKEIKEQFIKRLNKIFSLATNKSYFSPIMELKGIKHIDDPKTLHNFIFFAIPYPYKIRHVAHKEIKGWNSRILTMDELYGYFPTRKKNKFALENIRTYYDEELTLLSDRSMIDIDDFFTRLDLKIVELL